MKDLDTIYFAARELPPGERPAYLHEACRGDDPLRARVEQMLAVADAAEAFITDPPEGKPGALAPDDDIGATIGHYKIRERLGEGGCGVVYVAEQIEPVRRLVALKVIKLGMDTKAVVARFEAERQALAMMDHPNIAKVHDAGTTETGRPYFVMELVRGTRVTDYCDQNHLSTRDRLDLFIKVCHAIQHAHQKGIVHRDIKPSNILVTLHDGVPVPKVIDFGIAKATGGRLTDATIYTQLHQFIGTPAYMSPEQAEMSGLDVDTRSDIYSLGVLLYELLTGCTPFDAQTLMAAGVDAMRRTIREQEPKRPSTRLARLGLDHLTTAAQRRSVDTTRLLRQLAGDLDWIVMKCLEKDRTRRYATANGLATDLQRHLIHEPVTARAPSAAYKFQKAWQRNKIAFTAAAAVALALLAGAAISTWQAIRATNAQGAEVKQRLAAEKAEALASAQQKKAELEKQRAEEQLARAERLVYASKIMMAQTDFEMGNGGLALHYLSECQPNLRGWEHRYLSTRINAKQTLAGHTKEVSSVAYSPDGLRMVTGSYDSTAKVWDAATGQELFALTGHKGFVMSVAFSPDGQRIVTGGGPWGVGKLPGEAKVWDAQTGQLLLELKGHNYSVWSVAFSPDGQRIVTGATDWAGGLGDVMVWDARTGQNLLALVGQKAWVRSVAFSPDGQRLVTSGEGFTAKVWDAATGQELLTLKGHAGGVTSVAPGPGQRIVTGGDDGTAKVWDVVTGQELLAIKAHADVVRAVAFSPDGQRIITGSRDQTVKVWNAATGQEIFAIKGHAGHVRGVAFSPDGKRILTGSDDRTAKVWDATTGQNVPTLTGHMDFISGIAFSPDGRRIVTSSGDGTAKVWDTVTARELFAFGVPPSTSWRVAGFRGVAFSPDGTRIVTAGQDKTAKIWDAATGRELLALKHAKALSSVAFSPDGKRIVTGVGALYSTSKTPGEAKVWDAATGQELFTLERTDLVRSVAFSPDGKRIVTVGGNPTSKVWDAATGRELLALEGHTAPVNSVAFSPDSRRILTGSDDRTVRLWDAATGKEVLTLQGHTDNVRSVAFSPDGQRILTGGDDRTAKLWETASGQEMLTLKGHTHMVWSVAFSPDGQRIVTGIAGAAATAKVWSAAPPAAAPGAAEGK